MASGIELTQYRITKLIYELAGDYDGTLKIDPTIQFSTPSDNSPHIRCEYTLEMVGDSPGVFSLIIKAEGIFDVPELPLMPDGTLDMDTIHPIMRIMEQKLVESVETLTKDFGLPVLHLKINHSDHDD